MPTNDDALEVLNKAIADKEREVARLRAALDRYERAVNDLQALKRTKEILRGGTESVQGGIPMSDPRAIYRQRFYGGGNVLPPNISYNVVRHDQELASLSIAEAVEKVLRNGREMHVDVITQRLNDAGVDVNKQTITAVLIREVKNGRRFKKTGANTFALLDERREEKDQKDEESLESLFSDK